MDIDHTSWFNDMGPEMAHRFHLYGTDTEYCKHIISKLKNKKNKSPEELKKLVKAYSELGMDRYGNKKKKTCWDYIKGECPYKYCKKRHPEEEERLYLRKKKFSK